MIIPSSYKGKKVAILGLGKAGKAAYLSFERAGAEIFVWDDSGKSELNISHYKEWPWADIDVMVMSPGIPLTHPEPHPAVLLAKESGVKITGEVEILYQTCKHAKYIGITGTNGKSTTTALIGHILKECGRNVEIGGNLGTPALELKQLDKNGIYVIEMSSYQLDLCHDVHFDIACFLNLSPDHLDRHGDMEGYIKVKRRIFQNQTFDDFAVIGIDDNHSKEIAVYMDSILQENHVKRISENDKLKFKVSSFNSLKGKHNMQNASAAYQVVKALGLADDEIKNAMLSFPGLAHRMQFISEKNGVKFVNDSKATNADSAARALDTYDNIFWIAGGVAKAGGIEDLKQYFPKIKKAYLIGQDAEIFAKTLENSKVEYDISTTLEKAIESAASDAKSQENPTILLSPAAASFDQFKSFEERGEAFCSLVKHF